jgi:hypothetical protein
VSVEKMYTCTAIKNVLHEKRTYSYTGWWDYVIT